MSRVLFGKKQSTGLNYVATHGDKYDSWVGGR